MLPRRRNDPPARTPSDQVRVARAPIASASAARGNTLGVSSVLGLPLSDVQPAPTYDEMLLAAIPRARTPIGSEPKEGDGDENAPGPNPLFSGSGFGVEPAKPKNVRPFQP